MKNNLYLIIGAIVVLLVIGFVIGRGTVSKDSIPMGGTVHNIQELFTSGITLGSEDEAPCFKIIDTDKGGLSYITVLNGVMTTTGGGANAFNIPSGCTGK